MFRAQALGESAHEINSPWIESVIANNAATKPSIETCGPGVALAAIGLSGLDARLFWIPPGSGATHRDLKFHRINLSFI
jgi:hypothetical protein